jgi:rod shape determining protein RodA
MKLADLTRFGQTDNNRDARKSLAVRLHIDVPLFVGLSMLALTSLVILYSSSGMSIDTVVRQSLRILLAFGIMLALAQISPQHLQRWSPWLYASGLVLLVLVLGIGHIGKGAQRWLDIGFVRFQPSEIMKLGVPMMLAWYFAEHPIPPRFWRMLFGAALIAMPVALIAKQPDLGTAMLISVGGFLVLFFAGMSWKLLVGMGITGGAMAPIAWSMMHDYQRQRVLTFINPETDPLGTGYHIIQSTIAIGSGGTYGKGWLNGTQSQLDFLPERSTDFIFAAFSEEFGFIGGCALLLIYMFVVARCLFIAAQGQDTFARLLSASLAVTFSCYVFINTGMVTGLLPVVGVPLPLVSYGGTSIVTLMAGFGILMSIHTHRKLLPT